MSEHLINLREEDVITRKSQKEKIPVQYYQSFTDDLVTTQDQEYKLPDDYVWEHTNPGYRFLSKLLYMIVWVVSFCYCRLCHVTFKNRRVLKDYQNQGYFLYGNHTQPVGDVLTPRHISPFKSMYTLASPANLGLPILGPMLTMGGAIIVPDSWRKLREFDRIVKKRIDQKHGIMIYPEAHVWPYYTKIRPFPDSAFHYPVQQQAPSFCVTTTYQKRKFGSKPRRTVYIDGPFLPKANLNKKAQQEQLHQEIYNCMVKRSRSSTYEYIKYQKKGEEA